jgi:V/A-type H+-transporting ATPase subunit I
MAVIPVRKVHIVVHKSVKKQFLEELQKEALVHITELEEKTRQAPEELARLHNALSQLSEYKKRSPLAMFFSVKRPVAFDILKAARTSYDYDKTVAELDTLRSVREQNHAQLHTLEESSTLLSAWVDVDIDLAALKSMKTTEALPAIVPSPEAWETIQEKAADTAYSFEHVNTIGTKMYCFFFVKKEQSARLRALLIENACEIVDFKTLSGKPKELIARLQQEHRETRTYIEELDRKEEKIAREMERLELAYDLVVNEQKQKDVAATLPETARTINIIGWVLKRNLKKLDKLVQKTQLAFYEIVEPEPDERPPVALQNAVLSTPYEMLIKLYSMPNPKEYDPTPFLAVFFPIMFGLCITDAMYGILLIFISLFLIRRVSGDKSLFNILLVGGIGSIVCGAIAGGWAGDLFEYISIEPLIRFRQALTLFNPVTHPMILIGIALGVGFIHMMLGIAIEVVDSLKNGEYDQAIFANLTWFIILPSIILYFAVFTSPIAKGILELILWLCIMGIIVASHPEGKPNPIDQLILGIIIWLLWYFGTSTAGKLLQFQYVIRIPQQALFAIIPLFIIELIRFQHMKRALGKIAWGLYNLYGISSYLGVLLSYVRLMALGMVTGVIAIAINKIAWMITGIPVIGFVLVVLILIPSHLFNLVINTLGGFIHTMRLQYIEFFGRFYSGGSKPFKPFQYETDYVEIR